MVLSRSGHRVGNTCRDGGAKRPAKRNTPGRQRMVAGNEQSFANPHRYDSLLRYLRRCITGEDHPFALPEIPVFLNDTIGAQDFRGGIEPSIGRRHMRVIAIDGFPRTSYPGILGALDTLPIQYRWNTRAILMDTAEARSYLDKPGKKWRSHIRDWK